VDLIASTCKCCRCHHRLHQAGLDIELAWNGDERYPLYEAYKPLFEIWPLQSGQSHIGHSVPAGQREGIPGNTEASCG
jgi:hypothetical protein